MTLRNLQLAAITFSVFASTALAQTSYPEVEPNTNKAEATTAGTITLVAGDSITGTTTGTLATALSTDITSVDQFRVKTGALPLGIYAHQLTITTTGTAGHTGSIRGLSQTAGVPQSTTDVALQTSLTTTTPPRANVWYGFGKQEEIYYRVTGTLTTTAPYVATLTTTPVTPTVIGGTFGAGPITVQTATGQTTDTEIYIYDSALNPVPLAHNDDNSLGGSVVNTNLAAGTYYVAISTYNLANDQSDLTPGETFTTGTLLDFPNAMADSSSATASAVSYSVTDNINTTPVVATKNSFFEVVWGTFTVSGVAGPPANDNCANAIALSGATVLGGLGTGTNDGTASCDTGGAASKDVWYTYTGGPYGGVLSLDTCTSTGIDTVLSVHASCGGAELACNDDCGAGPCAGPTSCLTVSLTPNQSVLIRVSDKGLGGSQFVLHSSFVGNPPVNDSCVNATVLAGPGSYGFDTTTATTAESTTGACFTPPGKNVWFSYAATTNGTLTVSTCGGITGGNSTDTEIWIYQGPGCPVAASLACNDDDTSCAAGTLNSTVTVPTTCGSVFMIEVGNFSTSTTTNIQGNVTVTEVGTTCSTPVTYYCAGDGTATACPCGNVGTAGNGCGNSLNPNGANLAASGIASVGGDTWLLSASGIPNGPGLYFQGTTQLNGGLGVVFGDGLRCTGGTVIRLGIVTGVANGSTYPSPNPPAANQIVISLKGFCLAGDIRNYQLWYRDSAAFCNPQVFNLTNAVNVTWTP